MHRSWSHVRLVMFAVGLSAALTSPAPAARAATRDARYEIVDLSHRVGGSGAYAISGSGLITGYLLAQPEQPHAFTFGVGGPVDLGTLGGDASLGRAVNAQGDVVGWSRLADASRHAFLYRAGRLTDLGTLGGTFSDAQAINDHGIVVGSSSGEGDLVEVPFVWTQASGMRPLALATGIGRALDIDQHDDICGFERTADGSLHGFLFPAGADTATDLGTLGGTDSKAYALNEARTVVGFSLDASNPPHFHAVAWQGGQIIDLGVLAGGHSVANDVNNEGTIVGFSYLADDEMVATIFEPGHDPVELNTLVAPDTAWRLNMAISINDEGDIVGIGTYQGEARAFELRRIRTPGAIPTSFALGVSPSVVHDAATLRLGLPRDARVTMRVVDVTGRMVGALDLGARAAGPLEVPLASVLPAGARSGMYFAVLTENGEIRARSRFALVR